MMIPSSPIGANIIPKPFLVYYGSISGVNGGAVSFYANYDLLVLSNPATQADKDVVSSLVKMGKKVFLYTYLGANGVSYPLLSDATLQTTMDTFASLGAGVFLDQCGYDFGTLRTQQNMAISYAHSKNMPLMVNAWSLADIFGTQPDFYPAANVSLNANNPTNLPTQIRAGDYVILESFGATYTGYRAAGATSTDGTGYWGEANRIVSLDYYVRNYGIIPLVLGYPRTVDSTSGGALIDKQSDVDFIYKLTSFSNIPYYSVNTADLGGGTNVTTSFFPTQSARVMDTAQSVGSLAVTSNDRTLLNRSVDGVNYQYSTGSVVTLPY